MKRRRLLLIPLVALLLSGCKTSSSEGSVVTTTSSEAQLHQLVSLLVAQAVWRLMVSLFSATVKPEGAPQSVARATSDKQRLLPTVVK